MAGKFTVEQEVLKRSGVDPRILNFAIFSGYTTTASDLTLEEQVARLRRKHPEMDREAALVMLGDNLKDDIAEFFNRAFPVVGSNV